MTNYQKLARAERQRILRGGRYASLGKALENVAAMIMQGFDSDSQGGLAEARAFLEGMEIRDVVGYSPWGEVIYTSDLAWAIDFAESATEMGVVA